MDKRFTTIIHLIKQSRMNALRAVNSELITLYWTIGEYISNKISQSEWGDSVVEELAKYIQVNEPDVKGFSDKNIWRMKQFYEAYKDFPKLSSLAREISWTNNTLIFSRCKTSEEREFYLKLITKEKYSSRELERQINSSVFERVMLHATKLSALPREINDTLSNTFKDSYVFEFLNLPDKKIVQQKLHELFDTGNKMHMMYKLFLCQFFLPIFRYNLKPFYYAFFI